MKQKKYRQNHKIKRMFRIKGEYEATKLAQNFAHYMTNPFQDKRIWNELIDTENEIYITDISNDNDIKHLYHCKLVPIILPRRCWAC